jgi:protein associated with RNAse G/E
LSGEFIGRYVNINTPVEFYPDRIRYIDLEVDVAVWPDGSVQCLDQEELDTLHEAGLMSSRLLLRARDEAAQAAATGLWDNE